MNSVSYPIIITPRKAFKDHCSNKSKFYCKFPKENDQAYMLDFLK